MVRLTDAWCLKNISENDNVTAFCKNYIEYFHKLSKIWKGLESKLCFKDLDTLFPFFFSHGDHKTIVVVYFIWSFKSFYTLQLSWAVYSVPFKMQCSRQLSQLSTSLRGMKTALLSPEGEVRSSWSRRG